MKILKSGSRELWELKTGCMGSILFFILAIGLIISGIAGIISNENGMTITECIGYIAIGVLVGYCCYLYAKHILYELSGGTGEYVNREKKESTSIFQTTKNTRMLIKDNTRYIRSDVMVSLTRSEINWLLSNNVKTVIDLRSDKERKEKRCCLEKEKDFSYLHMPVTGGNSIPESPVQVATSYLNMIDDKMVEIINTIEKSKDNVIFFCNAGKDRTGVVAALLLKRMGISNEDIIADYMESAGNLERKLYAYAKENPDVDVNVIMPQRGYMEEFLELCDERWEKYPEDVG